MMLIKREGVLLQGTDLYFENGGVLNPAVYQDGQTVHLFYRGIQNGGVSMIGYCRLEGPVTVVYRSPDPVIVPEFAYEAYGVEDPRIVKIDDTWFLTYTAFDGTYALGALATSNDLTVFIKKGTIVPKWTYSRFISLGAKSHAPEKYFNYTEKELWDKNVMFFPRRIDGKLYFLHRIRPGILIGSVKTLDQLTQDHWERYFEDLHLHILLDPLYPHESVYLGGGCPPVETEKGWLVIYHGTGYQQEQHVYVACAALLDINDPYKVIARLPYALFTPEEPWERSGTVNDVVFPTGTAIFGPKLYIYYGCADTRIGVASIELDELLWELLRYPVNTPAPPPIHR